MKIVIIGNGIAGVMTASNLRQIEPDKSRITIALFTREPFAYYARIKLPEIFGLNKVINDIQLFRDDWYEQKEINVHYGMNVIGIDREGKNILLENGSSESYDLLVLACGAESLMPDIPNNNLPGIFRIREYRDAEALKIHIQKGARRGIVLGGGLLGLETARFMKDMGDITVMEMYPRLLPRQLDDDGADILRSIIEDLGTKVMLNVRTRGFVGTDRLEGIQLTDSRELEADTAVVSVGIVPRTELARNAGLDFNRGIVANEYLQSSDPSIYLAGDDVEFEGVVMGIIPAAIDHALVVAHNILNEKSMKYRQTIPKTTLKIAGIDLTSIGRVILAPEEEKEYEILSKKDTTHKTYLKYVLKDGTLVGCIALGDKGKVKWAEQHVGKTVSKDELVF